MEEKLKPSRKWRSQSLLKLLGASVALSLGVIAIPSAVAEDTNGQSEPFPSQACGQFLKPAKVLPDDLTPDRKPIVPRALPNGKATPVILVHGWTGTNRHEGHNPHDGNSQFSLYVDRVADGGKGYVVPQDQVYSSLVGMIQNIPGAAVYMFDYTQVASHWVTDPQIGRKLADGIQCLTQHYGNKAIVIGHSMGGLAARQALSQPGRDGQQVSSKVRQLITFGTPNNGTQLLKTLNNLIDGSLWVPGVNIFTGVTKLIMKHCSKKSDQTGKGCFGVGGPVDALYSQGALAMLPDSQQLKHLPKVPKNVPYIALAGDIQIGGFTFFGRKPKRLLDMGDFAVPHDSAIAGANESVSTQCEYGIAVIGGPRNRLSLGQRMRGYKTTGLFFPIDKNRDFATPCFHNNLMSERTLTNKALQTIRTLVQSPLPVEGGSIPVPTPASEPPQLPAQVPGQVPTQSPVPVPAPAQEPASTPPGLPKINVIQ